MTNPFGSRLDAEGLQHIYMSHAEAEYAAHAINQHDTALELLRLAWDVIDDDLEERAPRHSLGNLSARIKHLLETEAAEGSQE